MRLHGDDAEHGAARSVLRKPRHGQRRGAERQAVRRPRGRDRTDTDAEGTTDVGRHHDERIALQLIGGVEQAEGDDRVVRQPMPLHQHPELLGVGAAEDAELLARLGTQLFAGANQLVEDGAGLGLRLPAHERVLRFSLKSR
jgi:hypothetical protein